MQAPAINYALGHLEIRNPALFHPGRQRLALELMRELLGDTRILSVRLSLGYGICRVNYACPDPGPRAAAELYTAALRRAVDREAAGTRHCVAFVNVWSQLVGYRQNHRAEIFRVDEQAPGFLRFRLLEPTGVPHAWEAIIDCAGGLPGVASVHVRRWPLRGLDLEYDERKLSQDRLLEAMARIFSPQPLPAAAIQPANASTFVVKGPRRYLYLALGGGSLTLSVIGLILPGLPAIPFLLASSYYLARSSRELHRKLMNSALLGQILREWESCKGMSLDSKRKLAAVTLVFVGITLALAPVGPWLLLGMAGTALMTLYGISRIPPIPETRELQNHQERALRPA
jgi:uncharacterized membrane protein YbaN (DUF454 family)